MTHLLRGRAAELAREAEWARQLGGTAEERAALAAQRGGVAAHLTLLAWASLKKKPLRSPFGDPSPG